MREAVQRRRETRGSEPRTAALVYLLLIHVRCNAALTDVLYPTLFASVWYFSESSAAGASSSCWASAFLKVGKSLRSDHSSVMYYKVCQMGLWPINTAMYSRPQQHLEAMSTRYLQFNVILYNSINFFN